MSLHSRSNPPIELLLPPGIIEPLCVRVNASASAKLHKKNDKNYCARTFFINLF